MHYESTYYTRILTYVQYASMPVYDVESGALTWLVHLQAKAAEIMQGEFLPVLEGPPPAGVETRGWNNVTELTGPWRRLFSPLHYEFQLREMSLHVPR